jgi:hypothetical protein
VRVPAPVDYDELTAAADLLEHFGNYWDECGKLPDTFEARQQLVAKIIDRVIVYDDAIVAVILHGSFGIVLGQNQTAPAGLADAVCEVLLNEGITTSLDSSSCGSDGGRSLVGLLILAAFDDVLSHRIVGIISQRIA